MAQRLRGGPGPGESEMAELQRLRLARTPSARAKALADLEHEVDWLLKSDHVVWWEKAARQLEEWQDVLPVSDREEELEREFGARLDARNIRWAQLESAAAAAVADDWVSVVVDNDDDN